MNRDDIKRNLLTRLKQKSPVWENLSQSIVGRELLEYGTEVIASFQDMKTTLTEGFNYKLANERQLISLGLVYDIPISFTKPSTISIRVKTPVGRVFKPFEIRYEVGSTSFTNIEYVLDTEEITLYQGTVKFKRSDGTSGDVMGFNAKYDSGWTRKVISMPNGYDICGVDLGEAMPESVYVVDVKSRSIVSEYTPMKEEEHVVSYKKTTLFDKSLLVVEPGYWGKAWDDTVIYWLRLTNNQFNTTKSKISWSGSGEIDVQILSSENGSENDLNFARSYFRRFFLKMNAICSVSQIKDYVNSLPGVLDSEVTALNDEITVTIKPTDKNSSDRRFGGIKLDLERVGIIGTTFKVLKANAIPLTLQISGDFTNDEQSLVANKILEEFSYENLKLNSVLNINKVESIVSQITAKNADVTLIAQNVPNTQRLTLVPQRGTVKLMSGDVIIGFDGNGTLYGATEKVPFNINQAVSAGNLLYYNDYFVNISEDISKSLAIKSNLDWTTDTVFANGEFVYTISNLYDGKRTISVYNTLQLTETTVLSGTEPLLSWVVENFTGETNLIVETGTHALPLMWNQTTMLLSAVVGSNLLVKFYTKNSPEHFYSISIPISSGLKLVGYRVSEELELYLSDGQIISIRDIDSLAINWEKRHSGIQSIDWFASVTGTTALISHSDSGVSTLYVYEGSEFVSKASGDANKFYNLLIAGDKILTGGLIYYNNNTAECVGAYVLDGIENDSVVGTVNYTTGELYYSGTGTLTYESVVVNKSNTDFVMLNESNPIIWR